MDSANKTYKVWLEIEQFDEETGEAENLDTPGSSLATFETFEQARDYAEHITHLASPRRGIDATGQDQLPPAKDSLPEHVAKAIDEILWYLWQEGIEAFIADEPAPDEPHIFRALSTVDGWFDGHRASAEDLVRQFYTTADQETARKRVRTFRG